MQVDKQVIDSVNAVVKVQVVKADYEDKVETTLKKYRKKANIPGFRPGFVPASLIKKLYGKSVLAEEVQNTISEALFKYIQDNKISLLGEPLPSAEQAEIDFETQEDFEFSFDIALAPELTFSISKKDVVPYYTIDITDKMVEDQVKSLAARNGSYIKVEKSEESDVLKGLLTEILPEGKSDSKQITVEEAVLMPSYFKNEEEKAKMIGLGIGDKVVFNPAKAYDKNEGELASLLHISKEVAKNVDSDFDFEIKEITRYKEGEINQALFDGIYGKDVIKSEDEFKAKVKESLISQFVPESDYRFMVDARNTFLKKVEDVVFPVDFLKRWLLATKEGKKPEDVDSEMPAMIEDLKWHLMKEKIAQDNSISVNDDELLETARKITRAQFAQYGMMNVPDDLLSGYASDMLKKEESKRNVIDQAMSNAISGWLKDNVKLDNKDISLEDFNKLYA